MPPTRISKNPAERSRLYFLICWFHALVQERLRYRPLGWAHSYEFSDADLRVACDTLDAAVDSVALVSNLTERYLITRVHHFFRAEQMSRPTSSRGTPFAPCYRNASTEARSTTSLTRYN